MGEVLWYLRTVYHPRYTIKHFIARQPKLEVVLSVVAVYGSLSLIEGQNIRRTTASVGVFAKQIKTDFFPGFA